MRKWLLGVILAFFVLPSAAFADGGKIEFRFPDGLETAGGAFRVALEMTENPGFSAMQFTLMWEPKEMTCERISFGSLLDGTLSASNPSAPEGAIVAAVSTRPITQTGELAVFTFRSKSAPVNARWMISDAEIVDAENHSVPFEFVGAESLVPNDASRATGEQSASAATPRNPAPSKKSPTGGATSAPSKETPTDGVTSEAVPTDAPEAVSYEESPFTDIEDSWAKDYILQGFRLHLFGGYSDGSFRPGNSLTRAQFMTVLWNLSNRPAPEGKCPFTDMETKIPDFQNAVAWAYGRGIVNGTSPVSFSPDAPLTRQAAMKILFGYDGGNSGMERLLTDVYDKTFTDSQLISGWGKEGMYWGVYHEIITGATPTTLNPAGWITRAQMAAIMVRYVNGLGSKFLPGGTAAGE